MKILFVRHGESADDLINAYGGWADFPLTQNGASQIEKTAEKIKDLDLKFSKIYSSPLSRASSTAKIISDKLGIPFEICEYFKERNSYGILSGMVKEEARNKYLVQVEKLVAGEYVDGSERKEDLTSRVKVALGILKDTKDENVIVVTHGVILMEIMSQLLGKKIIKKEDGGFILIDLDKANPSVIMSDGIEVE